MFKENLKVITNSVIEGIWSEKTNPESIGETIRSAFFELYKGGFDEIQELDEEQLYSSYLNSVAYTDRPAFENNISAFQKNLSGKKPAPHCFHIITETDEMHQFEPSYVYDREAVSRESKEESPRIPVYDSIVVESNYKPGTVKRGLGPKLDVHISLRDENGSKECLSEDMKRTENMQRWLRGQRRDFEMSPRNFIIDENSLNGSNKLVNSEEEAAESCDDIPVSALREKSQITSELIQRKKLKSIAKRSTLKTRHLMESHTRYTGSRDLNPKAHVSQKDLLATSAHIPPMQENPKNSKPEPYNHKIFHMRKKSIVEKSQALPLSHNRHKSYNFARDRRLYVESSSLKLDLTIRSQKRLKGGQGDISTQSREGSYKSKM